MKAETDEVDVLVAGAGAAGMTAALVCALQGLDVLLCEKSLQVGGTTATSAGTIWVPGTKQARGAGFAGRHSLTRGAIRFRSSAAATDGRRDAYPDDRSGSWSTISRKKTAK